MNTDLAVTIPPNVIKNAGKPVFPVVRGGMHDDYAVLLPLIDRREQYGIAKYGQTLMTDDGRDTPTEVMNEAIDLSVYLIKWFMQVGDVENCDGEIMNLAMDARDLMLKIYRKVEQMRLEANP